MQTPSFPISYPSSLAISCHTTQHRAYTHSPITHLHINIKAGLLSLWDNVAPTVVLPVNFFSDCNCSVNKRISVCDGDKCQRRRS